MFSQAAAKGTGIHAKKSPMLLKIYCWLVVIRPPISIFVILLIQYHPVQVTGTGQLSMADL